MKEVYLNKNSYKKKSDWKLKFYIIIAVLIIVLGGIIYAVVYSPLFKIKNISVEGSQIFNNDILIQDLGDFFTQQSGMAKILKMGNILSWETDKNVLNNFIKKYPHIAELSIDKDYIHRQIKISVKEREKFGIWCVVNRPNDEQIKANEEQISNKISTSDVTFDKNSLPFVENLGESSCWWFDKSGVLFLNAPGVEGVLINKVEDASGRQLKLGDNVLTSEFTANLMNIFKVLDESNIKIKTLELQDLKFQEVVAESSGSNPKIYFSLQFNPDFSLAAFLDKCPV